MSASVVSHSVPAVGPLQLMVNQSTGVRQMVPLIRLPIVIGRDSDCGLQIIDMQASRQHCRIDLEDRKLFLTDLRSRNGTLLNSRRVTAPTPLQVGDRIIVGRTVIQLVADITRPISSQTTLIDTHPVESATRRVV